MRSGDDRRGTRRLRGALVVLGIACLALGCAERRAERAFRRAVAKEQAKSLGEARADLERIVARWPLTAGAARAREEIQWIDDFRQSSERGRWLLAWDAVRRVGAAAERRKLSAGHYPERFEELVPRFLPGPVHDPWGRPVGYRRTPRGYQAICYGADGIPGGEGDAADILVENGRRVAPAPPHRR